VLVAHGGGLGDARIELSLTRDGPDTRVTMVEIPVAGPGKWVHNPIADAVLTRRNTEALPRRTAHHAHQVERRVRGRVGSVVSAVASGLGLMRCCWSGRVGG